MEIDEYNAHLTARLQASLSLPFRNYMRDATTSLSPGASATGLAIILRQSYLAVADDWHGLNKSVRQKTHRACLSLGGPYKNGYSPQMRQLQVYMAFYHNLLRVVFVFIYYTLLLAADFLSDDLPLRVLKSISTARQFYNLLYIRYFGNMGRCII